MILSREKVRSECDSRWAEGSWSESGQEPLTDHDDSLPWIPYEEYMEAQIEVRGDLGILRVRFPAASSEDNRLHRHPESDRIITVLEGSGTFVYLREGTLCNRYLRVGDRIWMPKGVTHTFLSGRHGMTVESVHSPWVPLEDDECLVYPDSCPSLDELRKVL